MHRIFHILTLLLPILAQVQKCQAGDQEFWKAIEHLAEQDQGSDISEFLKTGHLPSEAASLKQHGSGTSRLFPSPPLFADRWYGPNLEALRPRTPSESGSSSTSDQSGLEQDASNEVQTSVHTEQTSPSSIRELPQIQVPPPLTTEERFSILEPIGAHFAARIAPFKPSIVHPFAGSLLTHELMLEAFGYPNRKLRKVEGEIYVIPSKRVGETPIVSIRDGGMMLTRPRTAHLYVWKRRQPPQGREGSIYQLVGVVEAGIDTRNVLSSMQGFKTGRATVRIGPDSLYDKVPLQAL